MTRTPHPALRRSPRPAGPVKLALPDLGRDQILEAFSRLRPERVSFDPRPGWLTVTAEETKEKRP